MSGPWSDLDRPPLSTRALTAALVREGELWREVRVVPETASTNDDVAAAARAGGAEGLVIVAEQQTAGRGRMDRDWISPRAAGLTFSVLLRPTGVPMARLSWLPLLVGLAVRRAVRRLAEVDVELKWPNDVLVDDRKLAGILVQMAGDAAVVGVGLNISNRQDELPRPDATSLALEEAACTDRDPILRAVLRDLASDYVGWRAVTGDPERSGVREAYLDACGTIGRAVSVSLPSGDLLVGTATTVDGDGRLVVASATGERPVAAGDVIHVR